MDEEIKVEYFKLLRSGMLWEFFPLLEGEWIKDKDSFTEFYKNRLKFIN